jgi:hypothetical protein
MGARRGSLAGFVGAAALAALAACGSPPPAAPLSHRAAAVAPGRTLVALAAGEDHLVIAEVTADKVVVLLEDARAGDLIGWLDERTLVAVATPREQGAVTVSWFVDARRTETITIPAAEWPRPLFVELVLAGRDEVWLSKCMPETPRSECAGQREYLRVWPGPRVSTTTPPPRGEPDRATNTSIPPPWPLPPAAVPAPGVELAILPPADRAAPLARRVACDRAGATSTYPSAGHGDGTFELRPRATRWVSTRPPIYEVAADVKNLLGNVSPLRLYFRPCEPDPMGDYVHLGDDRWAEFAPVPAEIDNAGTWTFHRGEAIIGTLVGTGRLRSNLRAAQ